MQVQAILESAKMRIEVAGLTDVMTCFKEGMKESNKAVLKVNILVLGSLAEAIGPKIKQYFKKCFEPMAFNLSDKQTLVRQDVIQCMNKWAEALESHSEIISVIAKNMEVENPEMREEGFKWILEHLDGIKGCDH